MWYGEPLIAEAEWPWPQSIDVPMCPPQASTGFGDIRDEVDRDAVVRVGAGRQRSR